MSDGLRHVASAWRNLTCMILGFTTSNVRVYIPKTGAASSTNPTPASRFSGGACSNTAPALTGTFWQAPPNNPAVTGYSEATNGQMTWDYVP